MAMIRFSRKLDKRLQKIVQKVLQRNAYLGHSSAVLLAMLEDPDPAIRARAVNQVKTIRMKSQEESHVFEGESDDGQGVDEEDDDNEEDDDTEDDILHMDMHEKAAISTLKVREFIIPKINFEATEYPDMIDWETSKLSEPPLTLSLSIEELDAIKETP